MIIVALILLGLCAGSFVNALIYRLHEQRRAKTRQSKKELSIVSGRSICPHCRHELAVKDLVPVFSWLSLRGKCRYCHKKIDDNPLIELTTPLLFVFSYIYWPFVFNAEGNTLLVFWLLFLVGFVALTVYDLKWMILPDKITYPLFGLAILQLVLNVAFFHGGWDAVLAAGWGILLLSGLFYGLFQLSKGQWIGGGDVKLGIILGMLVGGPSHALLVLFLASLIGTLLALPLMITGRTKISSRIPFGPMLLIATFIVYLFGASLIGWYKKQLLIY